MEGSHRRGAVVGHGTTPVQLNRCAVEQPSSSPGS